MADFDFDSEDGATDATPFGPPSPFVNASADQPGTDGPPKEVFTTAPTVGESGGKLTFDDDDLPTEGEKADDPGLSSSKSAHVDIGTGTSGPSSGNVDYSSLFATTVKAGGDIAVAAVGKGQATPVAVSNGTGLPGPVAASIAAAAATRQAAVNQQKPKPATQGAAAPAQSNQAGMLTGGKVALGLGAVFVAGVVTVAATKRGRR